jgi:hypothetical protein
VLSAHDPHALAGIAPAQTAAWDAFWNAPSLDDAGTSHETTPIQRLHPGVAGMRDTLVSTYRR